jgi:hypothetical protein
VAPSQANSGPRTDRPSRKSADQWDLYWGDQLQKSSKYKRKILRIIYWNCGGFPNAGDHPKNQVIRQVLTDTQADMAALSEINTSWKMVRPEDRLHERMWGWFSSIHISNSYAYNFPSASANLAGGTAIFTVNDATHQVTEKTQDNMGRWTSTKLKGRASTSIRLIAAYRCVRNLHGPLSVWNQQRYLLDLENNPADPIELFDRQLLSFIEQCLAAGEQIILGIDANEDIRVGSFSRIMKEIGLTEICTHKHGTLAPPTYARGSTPIDAIFVSSTLKESKCGYLPVVCDHRILWIDIPIQIALGRDIPTSAGRCPQRLKLQDPRVVNKYVSVLTETLQSNNVLSRLKTLQQSIQESLTDAELHEYNALDDLRLKAIKKADRKCRHLRMGQVPYSPQLVMAWNKLKAWQLLLKKRKGRRVNSRYLQRSLKKAGIKDWTLLPVEEVVENLADAGITYRRLKKEAPNL